MNNDIDILKTFLTKLGFEYSDYGKDYIYTSKDMNYKIAIYCGAYKIFYEYSGEDDYITKNWNLEDYNSCIQFIKTSKEFLYKIRKSKVDKLF